MRWTSVTFTSWTDVAVRSTTCFAATPAAVHTYMNIVSIRVLEDATADAEKHTGTIRLPPVFRFGTIAACGTL